MQNTNHEPGRRSLPHLASLEFANQTVLQFVTVCVDKRRPLLARPEIVAVLLDSWRKADRWLVGRYVVMPDHVHFFCAPATMPITPLKQWVQFWRADTTRHWPYPNETPIWQKAFLTANCVMAKATGRNGFISGKIQSRTDSSNSRKTGRSKVNSTRSFGMNRHNSFFGGTSYTSSYSKFQSGTRGTRPSECYCA